VAVPVEAPRQQEFADRLDVAERVSPTSAIAANTAATAGPASTSIWPSGSKRLSVATSGWVITASATESGATIRVRIDQARNGRSPPASGTSRVALSTGKSTEPADSGRTRPPRA
jgi:hypothetical protein